MPERELFPICIGHANGIFWLRIWLFRLENGICGNPTASRRLNNIRIDNIRM